MASNQQQYDNTKTVFWSRAWSWLTVLSNPRGNSRNWLWGNWITVIMCLWSSNLDNDVYYFRMTGTTIIKITYGIEGLTFSRNMLPFACDLTLLCLLQALENGDPWVELNENMSTTLKHLGAAGAHPADLFPSCVYLILTCGVRCSL